MRYAVSHNPSSRFGRPSGIPVDFISSAMRTSGETDIAFLRKHSAADHSISGSGVEKQEKQSLAESSADDAGCYADGMDYHTMEPPSNGEFAAASAKFQERQSRPKRKKRKRGTNKSVVFRTNFHLGKIYFSISAGDPSISRRRGRSFRYIR